LLRATVHKIYFGKPVLVVSASVIVSIRGSAPWFRISRLLNELECNLALSGPSKTV
jgi:hypothetical protein